jgi:hypothetical protein
VMNNRQAVFRSRMVSAEPQFIDQHLCVLLGQAFEGLSGLCAIRLYSQPLGINAGLDLLSGRKSIGGRHVKAGIDAAVVLG